MQWLLVQLQLSKIVAFEGIAKVRRSPVKRFGGLKCQSLFVSGEGFQVKLMLLVSLGFCKLLRYPLTKYTQEKVLPTVPRSSWDTRRRVTWALTADLLPNCGPGRSKQYRKPVTTGKTVISIVRGESFDVHQILLKLKFTCLPFWLSAICLPLTISFCIFCSQWFWWGFLGRLFSDAQSCCIKILTKFPTA